MKCPRDGTELERVDVIGVDLDKCHQCDGIWLDYGELEALRALKIEHVEEVLEQKYGNPPVKPHQVEAYMRCPRCEDGRLSSHHISYFVPVRVDRCQTCHGIWLDDTELDALLADRKKMDQEVGDKSLLAALKGLFDRMGGTSR